MEDKLIGYDDLEDDNTLIATFLGAVRNKGNFKKGTIGYNIWYFPEPIVESSNCITCNAQQEYEGYSFFRKELRFNSDWNWLMKVVEKIESLDLRDRFYSWEEGETTHYNLLDISVDIERNECWIYANLSLDPAMCLAVNVCDSKIEAVYKSILDFLKWYNTK